jgi:hypothetical protein
VTCDGRSTLLNSVTEEAHTWIAVESDEGQCALEEYGLDRRRLQV